MSRGQVSVEELIGTWRGVESVSFLRVDEDGRYRIALSVEDIENSTVEHGRFTLEGTQFTFISSKDSKNCPPGARGSYEIEVLEEGSSGEDRIRMIKGEEECGIRGSSGDVVTLERLS